MTDGLSAFVRYFKVFHAKFQSNLIILFFFFEITAKMSGA